MTNHSCPIARRDLLAIGLGAITLPTLPAWAASASVTGYVLDTRFPAHTLAVPLGAWRHAIDGDVTPLWVGHLDDTWRTPRSGVVEGLTGTDVLFVLEHLAWDRQRRVVLRQPVADSYGPVPLVRWRIAPRRSA